MKTPKTPDELPPRPICNRFILPMIKRHRTTKFRHRSDRRVKDVRKSWRREWGV